MIDLRRLRALAAVVDTGSVTAAADQVGYSPSAISQHIAALEREVGTALLERAGRGVRPTAAGTLLTEHAHGLLCKVAEAEAALSALAAGSLGILRVVSFPTAGASLIPPALATVRRELPDLEVALRVEEPDVSLPLLRRAEAEVVVTVINSDRGEEPGDGLSWVHLLNDPYRVVLPRTHRLAGRRVIDLRDLADEHWVDTNCAASSCQEQAMNAFRHAGYQPRYSVQADEYWPAQGFVAAGLGPALIPSLALGALHEAVVVRRLKPQHDAVRHVWAATRPALVDQRPVRTMLDALKSAGAAHQAALGEGARSRR